MAKKTEMKTKKSKNAQDALERSQVKAPATTKSKKAAVAASASKAERTPRVLHGTNNDDHRNDDVVGVAVQMLRRRLWPYLERCLDPDVTTAPFVVDRLAQDLVRELEHTHPFEPRQTATVDDANAANVGTTTETLAAVALQQCLDCAMSSQETDSAARVLDVVACAGALTGTLPSLVDRALQFSQVVLERVRCLSLHFLGEAVHRLTASGPTAAPAALTAAQSDALWDRIAHAISRSCTDKSKLVRHAAVQASQKLFQNDDGSVEGTGVLQSVLWVLRHDPIAKNRMAALSALPITLQTTDAIVERVRDADGDVRVAALHHLTNPHDLDSELMAAVLQSGYTTRCSDTRNATLELVAAWMEAVDHDAVSLLRKLNVLQYESQGETLVQILVQLSKSSSSSSPFAERHREVLRNALAMVGCSDGPTVGDGSGGSECFITTSRPSVLTGEVLFLARIVCRDDSTFLDHVEWDVPHVTSLLERHVRALRDSLLHHGEHNDSDPVASNVRPSSMEEDWDTAGFVCQQLLLLAAALAVHEEGASRHLRQVVCHLLADPTTPDALIATSLQALYYTAPTSSASGAAATVHSQSRLNEATALVVECVRRLHTHRMEGVAGGGAECHDGDAASIDAGDASSHTTRDSYYQIRTLSIWNVLLEHLPSITPETERLLGESLEPALREALQETDIGVDDDSTMDDGDAPLEHRALVREAAVSCAGKLGLLWLASSAATGVPPPPPSSPIQPARDAIDSVDSVVPHLHRLRKYRTWLARLALHDTDEIRVQALLALTDWAVVGGGSVATFGSNNEIEDPVGIVENLLASFWDENNVFLLSVGAEVALKLLAAHAKLSQPQLWMARLVLLSFDETLQEDDDGGEGDFDVGSPVRLQQLLSVFFATYAATKRGRQALVQSLPSLLALSKKKTARMISYVYDVARHGAAVASTAAKETEHCNGGIDTTAVEVAIALATFVVDQCPTGAFLRTVCRSMGGMGLLEGDPPAQDRTLPSHTQSRLSALQQLLEELEMTLDDDAAFMALGHLRESLAGLNFENPGETKLGEESDADPSDEEDEESDGGSDEEDQGDDDDDASTTTEISAASASALAEESIVTTQGTLIATNKENARSEVGPNLRNSSGSLKRASDYGSKVSTDSDLAALADDGTSATSLEFSGTAYGGSPSGRLTKPRRSSASVLAQLEGEPSGRKARSSLGRPPSSKNPARRKHSSSSSSVLALLEHDG